MTEKILCRASFNIVHRSHALLASREVAARSCRYLFYCSRAALFESAIVKMQPSGGSSTWNSFLESSKQLARQASERASEFAESTSVLVRTQSHIFLRQCACCFVGGGQILGACTVPQSKIRVMCVSCFFDIDICRCSCACMTCDMCLLTSPHLSTTTCYQSFPQLHPPTPTPTPTPTSTRVPYQATQSTKALQEISSPYMSSSKPSQVHACVQCVSCLDNVYVCSSSACLRCIRHLRRSM